MGRKPKIDMIKFKTLFYDDHLSLKEISNYFNVTISSISSFRYRHNLPARGWAKGIPPRTGSKMSTEHKKILANANKGRKPHNYIKSDSVCMNCGKIFHVKPFQKKRGAGKYCSKKCFDSYRIGKNFPNDFFKKGEQHPFYVINKIIRNYSNTWTYREKKEIAEKCNWSCNHCGKEAKDKVIYKIASDFRFDHIKAISLGGSHNINNGQMLCVSCDLEKTKSDQIEIFNKHNFNY
jgi:hypothetical protein